MVERIKNKIVNWLAGRKFEEEHKAKLLELDMLVNQRVARIISEMDMFEPLMKHFHGIFSDEFEHPEDNLDYPSQLRLYMWGWQQQTDPHFKHLINWIMNTQANETLRHAPVTTDRILYGRAQLSTMLLFKNEVERLANHYLEEIAKRDGGTFDETIAVEE